MTRTRITHLAVAAVAVVMLLAAGAATASNMAFKINTQFPRPVSAGVVGNQCTLCDLWISLPYGSNITNLRQLCDSNGDGVITNTTDQVAFVSQQGTFVGGVLDPTRLDNFGTHTCTLIGSPNPPYQATRAVRLRMKPVATANQTINIVYVGQDVPGTQILLRNSATRGGVAGAGSCPQTLCDNWIDVAYHTTHTNIRGFCDTNGDGTPSGAAPDRAQFIVVQGTAANAMAVDSFQTHTCALPGSPNPAIAVGRAARVRLRQGSATVPVPDTLISVPHF